MIMTQAVFRVRSRDELLESSSPTIKPRFKIAKLGFLNSLNPYRKHLDSRTTLPRKRQRTKGVGKRALPVTERRTSMSKGKMK